VLSTLHTNDAPSTISRLLNMGVEPFLVTASLNLVLAQRLARKICEDCAAPDAGKPDLLKDLGFTPEQLATAQFKRGTGCNKCGGTGYRGRIALYEVMPLTDRLRDMVLQGCSTSELKEEMARAGIWSLRRSGMEKAMVGVTTLEEVRRVTAADSS